ncbi:peptide ABC transporter substrate-binding protein [Aerococcus kribbianus]|uniref:Peptide ABC transporter substrate-binding protein n=1 Tax=Aerococcus kribbianus TaxID=2999064 RepID=A0A9X3JCZ1_9LACT|nr:MULTISPECIES: peptide ABC transporter substrate-binding protein [unclassified Aerococcus]MCZ0716960.1 peptide ABC transporter substrate-binding protein [Aerococcus sp. YH-aer221]MCZ0725248.1 peptide ABC transporter substrate-binding protein [Aerococcus sp. YH-aer222]
MKKQSLLKATAIVGLSGLLLAACGNNGGGNSGGANGEGGKVLNWVESAEIPTMDATMATDAVSFNAMEAVNEGLYRQTKDGEYELGMLAEEPEISEDGLTYTYKLKEDAVWSNGEPVTADDFVYSWQRLTNPDTGAAYSYLIQGIVANADAVIKGEAEPSELGVKAIDDKTLEVKYEKPVPYLKGLLAMAPLFPLNQEFVEEKGDSYGTSAENVLYNGPFTLEGWDGTNLNWQLKKNDQYWDADTVKLDAIDYQVIKEGSTAINLFDSGELDFTTLGSEYAQARQDDPNRDSAPESTLAYLKMNQERNGKETPLANAKIREGIAKAVDKEAYVNDVLKNGSQAADYFVPKGLAKNPETNADFREDNGENLVSYNLEEAKAAFKEGLEEIGEDQITLELLTDDTEGAKRSAEFLQGQLTQNLDGLEVNIVAVPFKSRIAADDKQDYDLQVALWGADYADPINYLELFVTDGNNNNSSYSNPEYDALIQSAADETEDLTGRWEDLQAAEKLLLDDYAISPLYQRSQTYLENPAVKNVVRNQVGANTSFKWADKE